MALLLTWSDRGVAGPRPAHHGDRPGSDRGPIGRLLAQPESHGRYQQITVLCTTAGLVPAQQLAAELAPTEAMIDVVALAITDPSDYGQIFRALAPLLTSLPNRAGCDVLLSAGTPQMQTLWVILVQAGILPARMLQVIPAAFVPSVHPFAVREVKLDIDGFPEIRALRDEVVRLRAEVYGLSGQMVGESAPMQTLQRQIARVAPSELPVLICGETGTGKELVARALHQVSGRREGAFVAENCAAFTESVLASELFGHEAGAFTGAQRRRRGLFEMAHGGSLFLDEIGELSAQAQATLLRVLQEGALRRVGGETNIQVDVRLIVATHRDLGAMVKAGQFREDLYYRLRGIQLDVPPLRARIVDIERLVHHFLHQAERADLQVGDPAWRHLRAYLWPGNVRELRAEVMRWTVLCDRVVRVRDLATEIQHAASSVSERTLTTGETIVAGVSDLGATNSDVDATRESTLGIRPLADQVAEAEYRAIVEALELSGGVLARTARALHTDRNTLKRKMARYGIPRRAQE